MEDNRSSKKGGGKLEEMLLSLCTVGSQNALWDASKPSNSVEQFTRTVDLQRRIKIAVVFSVSSNFSLRHFSICYVSKTFNPV